MATGKLAEIAQVHADLQRHLARMDVETARDAPDMVELAAARLKLTQASRRRTTLIAEIVAELPATAPPQTRAGLEALRQDLQHARLTSAEHIGQWTTRSITRDWAGYRAASDRMRAAMRAQIDREALVLQTLRD